MIDVTVIGSGMPTDEQLAALKLYASVSDSTQEGILSSCLKRSMLAVQETAGKALLACTVKISAHDLKAGDTLRLYHGDGELTSVSSEPSGAGYTKLGTSLVFATPVRYVEVVYVTAPVEADVEALLPVVLRYATALYDGEDSGTLANILKEAAVWR